MCAEKKPRTSQFVRLWRIENGLLQEVSKSKLDVEDKLEGWIAKDISIIAPNLLVIGRQVPTDFGGFIDLLGMEENGDIVIIELKRNKTPREITAQVLDYASWVKNLTAVQIQAIANKSIGENDFESAYQKKFNKELPESINEQHKMLIVGSEIDDSSQRIINYLSDTYEVGINACTFNYFKDKNGEFIERTFLIEPSTQVVKQVTRLQNLTEEQLASKAENKGVGDIYNYLARGLVRLFDQKGTTRSSLAFTGRQDGKMNTIFSLIPEGSDPETGLKFQVYVKRFCKYFGISEDDAMKILPENKKEWHYTPEPEYSGFEGFFKNLDQAQDFLKKLQKN
jgi:hypothetical protein